MSTFGSDPLPPRRHRRDLRVLHVDPDVDDPARVRDGSRQPAAVLEDDVEGQPTLHTPIGTCVIVGALAAIPFIQFAGAAAIAVGATASIYLSYLLGNLAFMRARTKGWPKTKAPFSLGVWGKVVNVVAILWGAAMLLNFLTPSPANSAFDPNASGRVVPADLLEPEADPDRLLRRREAAGRLQDRIPEQDPRDLDGVLADRRSSARSTTSPSRGRSRSGRWSSPTRISRASHRAAEQAREDGRGPSCLPVLR